MGLVEGGERGIELLTEATSTLGESEARLEHARTLIDLGAAVRRTGRRGEAKQLLAEAMDLAHRCGATAEVERAHAELLAAGARPRRVALGGADALTPSERRVAQMAANGMANKEIAQALFVTLRTVETHLSHAYDKLEISSRQELTRALAA
jgi:DNA-binding NarL/FixJ family response regulator